jgi:hypothetical protein
MVGFRLSCRGVRRRFQKPRGSGKITEAIVLEAR